MNSQSLSWAMRSNRLILFFFFSFGQSKAQSGPVATEDLHFSAMQTSGYHSMPAALCYVLGPGWSRVGRYFLQRMLNFIMPGLVMLSHSTVFPSALWIILISPPVKWAGEELMQAEYSREEAEWRRNSCPRARYHFPMALSFGRCWLPLRRVPCHLWALVQPLDSFLSLKRDHKELIVGPC